MSYNYNRGNNNAIQKRDQKTAVQGIKDVASSPAMQARFREVLGTKAPAFISGVIAAVNTNSALQKADPNSVLGSAMVAATLNLSCVPSLGQSALVPYGGNCQFQIMTRGLVQLAQRTGQYRTINTGCVYEDEYEGEDLLSGEVKFHRVRGGMRDNGAVDKIVGYFAYIETVTGFRHTEYWTKEDVINHAVRFSKTAFVDDRGIVRFKEGTPWASFFDRMAEKTVLKSCLNHYGPMSVDSVIADAIAKDQMVFDSKGEGSYSDNPLNENGTSDAPVEEKREIPPKEANDKPQAVSDASYDDIPDDIYEELNELADFEGAEEF